MIDRVVQYPHRYRDKLTGQIFDLEPYPGEITEAGTPLNKASLLSDETANLYGLTGNNATVNSALDNVKRSTNSLENRYSSNFELYSKVKRYTDGSVAYKAYKTYTVNLTAAVRTVSSIVTLGSYYGPSPTYYIGILDFTDYGVDEVYLYVDSQKVVTARDNPMGAYTFYKVSSGDALKVQFTVDPRVASGTLKTVTIGIPQTFE